MDRRIDTRVNQSDALMELNVLYNIRQRQTSKINANSIEDVLKRIPETSNSTIVVFHVIFKFLKFLTLLHIFVHIARCYKTES